MHIFNIFWTILKSGALGHHQIMSFLLCEALSSLYLSSLQVSVVGVFFCSLVFSKWKKPLGSEKVESLSHCKIFHIFTFQ